MKGPEEREQSSGCSPEWLVEKSRQALESGDQFAAKSWLLTAKTLHPRAFSVQGTFCRDLGWPRDRKQWESGARVPLALDYGGTIDTLCSLGIIGVSYFIYEAFQMERRSGNLVPCGKLFLEMIKSFPNQELLWKELKRIVRSQELNVSELDNESRFLKEMSESLPVNYQRELLLKYADHQTNLVEKCRISLVVLKKFHGGIRQYGLKLIELLMKAEIDEQVSSPLNIYRKLFVCDVVPIILQSPEVLMEAGPKRKTNAIYLPETYLLKWLELSLEYFVTLSIQQSALKNRHFDNTFLHDADADQVPDEEASSWQLLHDHLMLFAAKCGWNNILKINNRIDPAYSKSLRGRWKAVLNSKDFKSASAWGVFFCTIELFFFAVIEYSSKMIRQVKGHVNVKDDEFILLECLDPTEMSKQANQNSVRTPKKKRKLGDGTVALSSPDSQFSLDDSFSNSGGDLMDFLQVAIECKQFIDSSQAISKEFTRILCEWRVENWEWMEIYEIDSLIYQRKYQTVIDIIKQRQSEPGATKTISKKHLAKQFSQMATCYYIIGAKKDACEMALNAVYAISEDTDTSSRDSAATTTKHFSEGRCFQKILCCQHEIIGFCIDVLIMCLKEKLTSVDIRPDQDKIGPLYDIRQDNIIGHLIVLLQFDWPKREALLEQLVKTIITLGGLKYEKFFAYVVNIDILEEFSYLNNLEKVQLELQGSVSKESSRKTVTRGVNRENKEDFRTFMDCQVERSSEPIRNVILRFLRDEQDNLLSYG